MTYKKQFDSDGKLLNPITKENPHISGASKRKAKRIIFNNPRFIGNGKNYPLVVTEVSKYVKSVQIVFNKKQDKFIKILHYNL